MKLKNNIYFSNQIEIIASQLAKDLFNEELHPLVRRYVIVPSPLVKDFLVEFFSREENGGIVAAVEFISLAQLLQIIASNGKILSVIELSLYIEKEIKRCIENGLSSKLVDYFKEGDHQKQLSSLSMKLARHFEKYGTYGDKFLDKWLKEDDWQQDLWKKVFIDPITYPIALSKQKIKFLYPVFLFGYSFLPRCYQRLLQQCELYSYQLSPSPYFWEDLCSDREKLFLHRKANVKQSEELDLYLSEQNRLLANLTKLGRVHWRLLLEDEPPYEELYSERTGDSLLQHIQSDFYQLTKKENVQNLPLEASLQIHAAPSRLRELESLKNQLFQFFHNCSDLNLSDVLIVAPNIEEYIPYIHTVFGGKENPLNYKIYDIKKSGQSEVIQGLKYLFEIAENDYESRSVLKLFSLPTFLEKNLLTKRDRDFIIEWVDKARIHRGIEGWQIGIKRLMAGICCEGSCQTDDPIRLCALEEINYGDLELFGFLCEFIDQLALDLLPIEKAQQCTGHFWVSHIEMLLEKYFIIHEKDRWLINDLKHTLSAFKEENLSFISIARLIDHLIKRPTGGFHKKELNAIRFASLSSAGAVSSDIISILGLQEGSFPKIEKRDSLSCFDPSLDYFPVSSDRDRYRFLELILNAGRALILSYVDDKKETNPSCLISELFDYLDRTYLIEGKLPSEMLLFKHPLNAFDCDYFNPQKSLNSFSQQAFQIASSLVENERGSSKPFLADWERSHPLDYQIASKPEHISIDLDVLQKFARHPLQYYCQKQLGLYIPPELNDDSFCDQFILSQLNRFILRRDTMHDSIEQLIKREDALGRLPEGLFKNVAIRRLQDESAQMQQELGVLNVEQKDLWSLQLKSHIDKPYFCSKTKTYFHPPLIFNLDQHVTIEIHGTIPWVTSQGLLFYGKDDLGDILKVWPHFLVFLMIAEKADFSPHLLMFKKAAIKTFAELAPDRLLEDYLCYFLLAQQRVSPLIPSWGSSLIQGDHLSLEKAINMSRNLSFDRYFNWLNKRGDKIDAKAICGNWSGYFQTVFAPLNEVRVHEGV